jgi:hypothetical protein
MIGDSHRDSDAVDSAGLVPVVVHGIQGDNDVRRRAAAVPESPVVEQADAEPLPEGDSDEPIVAVAVPVHEAGGDSVIVDMDGGSEMPPCLICYEPMDPQGQLEITALPCMHAFHTRCVGRWLSRNRNCPTCRRVVEDADLNPATVAVIEVHEAAPVVIDIPDAGEGQFAGGWHNAPLVPPSPLNSQAAVGHLQVVPTVQNIRVAVTSKWIGLKWALVIFLSCLLCFGCNWFSLTACMLLGIVLRPLCRLGLSLWRRSGLRERLLVPRPGLLPRDLTTNDMNVMMLEHLNEPVVELNPPPLVTFIAGLDSAIQRSSVFFGLTEQVMTGQLILGGRYVVPATDVDFRPTNYIGTTASRSLVEVCVSYIDNIHEQSSSMVFWSPEMVGQLMSSTRYIPAAQRALELGPRSSRITDQQLQSTFYSEVQAGSARVAMIRASGADMTDIHARATVLNFRPGSPSTPCMVSDIVPKTGAPFLMFLGMMLTSSFVQTSILQFCVYLFRSALGLF